MKDLDIQVRYDDIDFDFKNLMGGGIIGNTINVIINVIGEEIIKTQKGEMSGMMKDVFHDIMSQYLWEIIQFDFAIFEKELYFQNQKNHIWDIWKLSGIMMSKTLEYSSSNLTTSLRLIEQAHINAVLPWLSLAFNSILSEIPALTVMNLDRDTSDLSLLKCKQT